MRLGVAMMCAQLVAAAAAPNAEDLPTVEELVGQLISGELSPKDVLYMMPRMPLQYMVDLKHSMPGELMQQVIEFAERVHAAAPDANDLPSVDKLIEQLISGSLTSKDVIKMSPRMSRQYLQNVVQSLPDELMLQVNESMKNVNENVQADAHRGNDSAIGEITEELNQHRLLLYLSLGGVLSLAAVLVVALLLLLLVRRRSRGQQPADDQPPAMKKLTAALADRHLTMGGDDKRPCTTSGGSPLGSARLSVDSHQYEPVREDLPLPLPVAYHEYESVREDPLQPLPVASPPLVPIQNEGSCAVSLVYERLLDR